MIDGWLEGGNIFVLFVVCVEDSHSCTDSMVSGFPGKGWESPEFMGVTAGYSYKRAKTKPKYFLT